MDRRRFVAGSVATAAALASRTAHAQEVYPSRAVTFINPFPPGGAVDVVAPLIVQATLAIAAAIIAEASLSFLGLGQQPPAPSWGSMLNTAKNYLDQAPWMAIWPGVSIFLVVLSFNLLGDGLRDALDPRHV